MQFTEFILNNNVIGFHEQPITLRSGKQSHLYVNWRTITNDAFLLNQLADYIIQYINANNISADCIYGVPEGATKTAIIASLKLAQSQKYSKGTHIIPMGRAKPKEHGDIKDKFFIGAPTNNAIVIEDVTTTGNSLIETLDMLKANSITVTTAITLTDRMENKNLHQQMVQRNVTFHAMSTAAELIPLAIAQQKPSKAIIIAIQKELSIK
ncbi:MAG TPA: hypothetical protein VJH88_05170 [Candidatus Nanoarchaeia archaeon]|nr:hypothetical protein [Candidatus Nanoarchaeia archaeon]